MANSRKGRHTSVDGIIVRSMLEASWLKFFNLLGVDAEYEPGRFPDSISTIGYLPDYYLPEACIYIEIKPTYEIYLQERARLIGFTRATSKDLLVVVGKPPGRQLFLLHKRPDGKVIANMLEDTFCWSENPSFEMKQRERAVAKRAVDFVRDQTKLDTWLMRAMDHR